MDLVKHGKRQLKSTDAVHNTTSLLAAFPPHGAYPDLPSPLPPPLPLPRPRECLQPGPIWISRFSPALHRASG